DSSCNLKFVKACWHSSVDWTGYGSVRRWHYSPHVHSFIVCRLSKLHSGHGEPVPISGVIGHQGRIYPGQSARHTHTLIHSHNTDNLEMPINLPCMSLGWGRKPEHPEKTPETGRTCKLHTWRRRESNPQPWRCEANVLTTKPPCPPSPHVVIYKRCR
ncbi:hypothetical protein QTP70_027540, partial [Hemibagrus guttatus]